MCDDIPTEGTATTGLANRSATQARANPTPRKAKGIERRAGSGVAGSFKSIG